MTSPTSSKKLKKPKLFLVRRVMGDSMVPALVPGRVVLGIRTKKVRPGDVVVFWHEGRDKIKRVKDVQYNKVYLAGDNPMHSTDSRDFGWLGVEAILARVVWPKARA